jgi:hypothetical protein
MSKEARKVSVTLDPWELMTAAQVGVTRNIQAIKRGSKNSKYGNVADDSWNMHILGALGELAFCKVTGIYWPASVNTYKDADAGRNIQVRTRSKHSYELIVRKADPDEDLYVLVTGGPQQFVVHGYEVGHKVKDDAHLRNYGGMGRAWFYPQELLQDVGELFAGSRR